jgi:Leucine-rich repeat (LRR) protein
MKINLLTLILFLSAIITIAQTTNIPDVNFENYLETHTSNGGLVAVGDENSLGNGINGDHLVTTSKIKSATALRLSDLNISDLSGIEFFTSLTDLACSNNNLTSITLPEVTGLANLFIDDNNLTTLTFPNSLTSILEFTCYDNNLTSINFNNVTYINLLGAENNQLTTLDLSNTDVEGLSCSNNPLLTRIDIRNGADYTKIYHFDASNNPLLTCIFVDNLASVTTILRNGIDSNTNFVDSEASCNFKNTYTYVPDSNFEQALIDEGLDDVLDNYVLTANISTIGFLDVSNKNIADLTGIEDFTELVTLGCDNNQLTTLDLSSNHIMEFGCSNNQLTSLILNAEARVVGCSNNLLTTLIVPAGIANLQCNNNKITSLDLSNTNELSRLNVSNNNLEFLDFRNGENGQISSSYDFNTGYDYSFDATNNPNLTCIFVDDAAFSTTNWKKVDATSHFVLDQTGCDAASITYTYIPDDHFEQALIDLGFDSGTLDDYVPTANINTVEVLNISDKNISDLTGIEDFTALLELNCKLNSLTSLNVTKNTFLQELTFSNNQITTIDVSKNTDLEKLVCQENQLTSLDVTKNTSLKHLESWMNQIGIIDLSKNTILEELYVSANPITSLNITNNTDLKIVSFGGTMDTGSTISSIDISNNTQLTSLNFIFTQIAGLDVSNQPNLEVLFVRDNQLTNIDISQNPVLTDLVCNGNQLRTLNVKNGNNTNFTRFKARNNSFLSCIQVDDPVWSTTNWTSINGAETFGGNCHYFQTYIPDDNFEQALIDLGFDTGSLDDYVFTNTINTVTDLVIINKNILDLTGLEDFDALTYLDCSYNLLTRLATYNNEELSVLRCDHNELTSLDIMGNFNLTQLFCGNNKLTSLDYLYYAQELNSINFENNQISTIDLSANSKLLNLNAEGNNLTIVDISNNSKLTTLSGSNNQLTSLDVSKNPALFTLICSNNLLTELDVSNNPNISRLICKNNLLTSIDMRSGNNTHLSNNGSFYTINNPNLTCIFVDDVAWSTTNWTNIDAITNFVADEAACTSLAAANYGFKGFKILSNPAKDNINLSIEEEANFVLIDLNGKILKKGKLAIGNNAIKISNIAKGLCFLRITNNRFSSVKKIIIQ